MKNIFVTFLKRHTLAVVFLGFLFSGSSIFWTEDLMFSDAQLYSANFGWPVAFLEQNFSQLSPLKSDYPIIMKVGSPLEYPAHISNEVFIAAWLFNSAWFFVVFFLLYVTIPQIRFIFRLLYARYIFGVCLIAVVGLVSFFMYTTHKAQSQGVQVPPPSLMILSSPQTSNLPLPPPPDKPRKSVAISNEEARKMGLAVTEEEWAPIRAKQALIDATLASFTHGKLFNPTLKEMLFRDRGTKQVAVYGEFDSEASLYKLYVYDIEDGELRELISIPAKENYRFDVSIRKLGSNVLQVSYGSLGSEYGNIPPREFLVDPGNGIVKEVTADPIFSTSGRGTSVIFSPDETMYTKWGGSYAWSRDLIGGTTYSFPTLGCRNPFWLSPGVEVLCEYDGFLNIFDITTGEKQNTGIAYDSNMDRLYFDEGLIFHRIIGEGRDSYPRGIGVTKFSSRLFSTPKKEILFESDIEKGVWFNKYLPKTKEIIFSVGGVSYRAKLNNVYGTMAEITDRKCAASFGLKDREYMMCYLEKEDYSGEKAFFVVSSSGEHITELYEYSKSSPQASFYGFFEY